MLGKFRQYAVMFRIVNGGLTIYPAFIDMTGASDQPGFDEVEVW